MPAAAAARLAVLVVVMVVMVVVVMMMVVIVIVAAATAAMRIVFVQGVVLPVFVGVSPPLLNTMAAGMARGLGYGLRQPET